MTMLGTAWFHEDDCCQIELLPIAAEGFARQQAAAIDEVTVHKDDAGLGWSDLYTRREPPARLVDLKIGINAIAECIPLELGQFRTVTTGYSTHVEPARGTSAWGRDGEPMIFADVSDEGVIRSIWFAHFFRGDAKVIRRFVVDCAQQWPLMLADWAWTQIVNLADEAAVEAYFALREAVGTESNGAGR